MVLLLISHFHRIVHSIFLAPLFIQSAIYNVRRFVHENSSSERIRIGFCGSRQRRLVANAASIVRYLLLLLLLLLLELLLLLLLLLLFCCCCCCPC